MNWQEEQKKGLVDQIAEDMEESVCLKRQKKICDDCEKSTREKTLKEVGECLEKTQRIDRILAIPNSMIESLKEGRLP